MGIPSSCQEKLLQNDRTERLAVCVIGAVWQPVFLGIDEGLGAVVCCSGLGFIK
jgi:hypothetical protein